MAARTERKWCATLSKTRFNDIRALLIKHVHEGDVVEAILQDICQF